MTTQIGKLPKAVERYFTCLMLHKKIPYWDGTYIYDAFQDKHIPHIRHICQECNNEKTARPKE